MWSQDCKVLGRNVTRLDHISFICIYIYMKHEIPRHITSILLLYLCDCSPVILHQVTLALQLSEPDKTCVFDVFYLDQYLGQAVSQIYVTLLR